MGNYRRKGIIGHGFFPSACGDSQQHLLIISMCIYTLCTGQLGHMGTIMKRRLIYAKLKMYPIYWVRLENNNKVGGEIMYFFYPID